MSRRDAQTSAGRADGSRSNLIGLSLSLNIALAVVTAGMAVWGWDQQQRAKEFGRRAEAAVAERDEAYETSRKLQYGLIRARGDLKGLNPPTTTDDPENP
jgi:hypothetical protein